MNLNYIIQKKHIFKLRRIKQVHRPYKFHIGTEGIFSLQPQRFELVYLRGFKKCLRRRCIKTRRRFKKRKLWFFLRPNCILSGKSSNSRMGAGVGTMVRLAILLKSYRSFVETLGFSAFWLKKLSPYLRYRYPLKFVVAKK